MDNDERTCVVCGERIFWNGRRWAGVYILTDGDVCPDFANDEVRPDHTPEGETPRPGKHSLAINHVREVAHGTEDGNERVLMAKSVALVNVNAFG